MISKIKGKLSIFFIKFKCREYENGGHQYPHEDLLISDIQQNQSVTRGMGDGEEEDLEKFLKTGAFTKEMMMGQTLRDLGSTIKDAKAQI